MDGDLELIGGVEGDLDQLLVLGLAVHHVAVGQLCALEDRRLRRIAVHLPLQDAHLASIIVLRNDAGKKEISPRSGLH